MLAGTGAFRGRGTAPASLALEQGLAAYRAGKRDVALEQLQVAAHERPTDPTPHVYLSRLARDADDLATANDEAVKAVELDQNDGAALRELASTLFVQQNFAGARAFYTRAVKADPTDRLSQGFLGCSLIRLGRDDEGLRWIRRAGDGPWSSCAPATR
jgi:Flp pilus assembly protein TadD